MNLRRHCSQAGRILSIPGPRIYIRRCLYLDRTWCKTRSRRGSNCQERKMVLFVCFLLGATACFTLCTFLFPVLAAKPRKFGLLWTMGSLLFVLAFGVLMGPLAYLKHLTARERLPFSMFFFATCFMTIYFAAFSKNTVLTITCALLELVAVIYYAISYFPFGATGLRMLSSAGVNSARGVLRI